MWQELGIEPTTDAKAIRSAYARRLKALDPERDPAAFQRLRQAYEAALASAPARGEARRPADLKSMPVKRSDARERAPPSAAAPDALPSPGPSRPDAGGQAIYDPAPPLDPKDHARPVIRALHRALLDGDAQRALALLDEAIAKGDLPLVPDARLVDRLTDVVAEDRTLLAATFERLIRVFGWDAYPKTSRSPAVKRAVARLEAAAWYAQLVADAQQRRFGARDTERNIARVMLGRNKWLPLFAGQPVKRRLRSELALYDRHCRWLEGRFDPQHIEWLRARTRQNRGGSKRWYLILVSIVVAANLLRACLAINHS